MTDAELEAIRERVSATKSTWYLEDVPTLLDEVERLRAAVDIALADCWCGGRGTSLQPGGYPGHVLSAPCLYCSRAREALRRGGEG